MIENTDYIALNNQVDELLRGYYPSSKRFTRIILNEWHDMLFEIKATYETFTEALKKYRNTVEDGSSFPPNAIDLRRLMVQSSGGHEGSVDANKMVKYFAAMVKDHGWEEAHRRFTNGTSEESEWIGKFSVDSKYCCFPSWYKEYLEIFFTGDIIKSHQYYLQHTDKVDKTQLYQELDRYKSRGNNNIKKSFMVFRDKSESIDNKTLNQLKRFKLKGRLSKDRV